MRKIIHIDMDAFYAAVEQRDNPELRSRPIAVGGRPPRGVVMTASYEARPYGVQSAMSSAEARRRCPDLIFVPGRSGVYKEVSQKIHRIFRRYTDLVEPLSLDEAYLDVTSPKEGPPSALLIARRIKREIEAETGLTASAGVSTGKFVAKMASDLEKPDGLTLIAPDEVQDFLDTLAIEQFHGIGPVTADKMKAAGIHTGAHLRARTKRELLGRFGKRGRFWYKIARGIDQRPVRPNRERKSIGSENTFAEDIDSTAEMLRRLETIAEQVAHRMKRADTRGRTACLKIKYADFELTTRRRTLPRPIAQREELVEMGRLLLHEPTAPERPVRLLGLTVSNLVPKSGSADRQLAFDFYQRVSPEGLPANFRSA